MRRRQRRAGRGRHAASPSLAPGHRSCRSPPSRAGRAGFTPSSAAAGPQLVLADDTEPGLGDHRAGDAAGRPRRGSPQTTPVVQPSAAARSKAASRSRRSRRRGGRRPPAAGRGRASGQGTREHPPAAGRRRGPRCGRLRVSRRPHADPRRPVRAGPTWRLAARGGACGREVSAGRVMVILRKANTALVQYSFGRVDTAHCSMSRCAHAPDAHDDLLRDPRPARAEALDHLRAGQAGAAQPQLVLGRPRAERKLYDEPKGLVADGLATARAEQTGKRPRTVYDITPAGPPEELARWLGEPPRLRVTTEFEGMVKVFFADGGSRAQLLDTLDRMGADAQARLDELATYAAGPKLFPDRRHISALCLELYLAQEEAVVVKVCWAREKVQLWSATADPGGHPGTPTPRRWPRWPSGRRSARRHPRLPVDQSGPGDRAGPAAGAATVPTPRHQHQPVAGCARWFGAATPGRSTSCPSTRSRQPAAPAAPGGLGRGDPGRGRKVPWSLRAAPAEATVEVETPDPGGPP